MAVTEAPSRPEPMQDPTAPPTRVVETHISLLVFVADRVYKLRKPVRFGFLDFTDRAVREADCRREIQLNRRLAPDVYLGVADIVMDGVPIDHMVVMRALPAERRLATLVRSGADVEEWLSQVATVLAAFHAGAERSPAISDSASPSALQAQWEANFGETERFVGPVLDPGADRQIRILSVRWLEQNRRLLATRVASGRACDGHGDLQAEDVFCLDDGVRILDCIEFSDDLRYGDVCADVAFLAMDLERLGHPEAAAQFVSDYEAQAADEFPRTLLHHYVAQRAYVRAKVACLRAEQGDEDGAREARGLHALALRHLRLGRRAVVLVGGLPGSGKSTLATALAAETGWVLLRSDEVRGDLQRPAPTEVAPDPDVGRYAPAAVNATYNELLRRAARHLSDGEPVILDASWTDGSQRSAAARVASDAGAQLVELCCICEDAVAAARIEERRIRDRDASEATTRVRTVMEERAEAWPTATTIDTTSRTIGECVSSALGVVLTSLEALTTAGGT